MYLCKFKVKFDIMLQGLLHDPVKLSDKYYLLSIESSRGGENE